MGILNKFWVSPFLFIQMKNLFLILVLCVGCVTRPIADGWKHIGGNPNTSSLLVKGDYVITESGNSFTLIYRPNGTYVRVGVFPSVELAKQSAK